MLTKRHTCVFCLQIFVFMRCIDTTVLCGAGYPEWVVGTRICRVGAGTSRAIHVGAC